VAQNDKTVYFVEVKYRRNSLQGDGLEYITSKKLDQMTFAAELWVSNHRWQNEYCLAAAAVAGDNFSVTNFIEL
jgi:Holliday junction resolvase-like predicted endonuclease